MSSDSPRRVPTLVQYCQRVASLHVGAIRSFGDDVRYDIIRPILETCTPKDLHRLELASPHIQKDTEFIWKEMCMRTFSSAVERYIQDAGCAEPESWRGLYFVLRDSEAKRIEEIGSRIRSQRLLADERKKDREVKFTDRLPTPKRSRSASNTSAQSKSLFQQAKSNASRIRRAIHAARITPPKPSSQTLKASSILAQPPPTSTTRVTVRTVAIRSSSSAAAKPSANRCATSTSSGSPPVSTAAPRSLTSAPSRVPPSTPVAAADRTPNKLKKDPMAALFMPKHRAHSQLPPQYSPSK